VYTIEKLELADYKKCSNIRKLPSNPASEQFYCEMVSGVRTVFIYKENGTFLGEIAYVTDTGDSDYTIPGKRVYISRLIVKESERRRGIGSRLLDFVLAEVKRLGFSEAAIGVDKDNTAALALYRKKGFTTVLFDGEDEQGPYYKLLKQL